MNMSLYMHLIWIQTMASLFPLRPKCQQVIVLASVKCQHVSLWRLMMALSLNVIRRINLLSVRKLTGSEQHSAFFLGDTCCVCVLFYICFGCRQYALALNGLLQQRTQRNRASVWSVSELNPRLKIHLHTKNTAP